MPARKFTTKYLLWFSFVFTIGTISWALLLGSLLALSAVIVTPVLAEVRDAEVDRNNVQASVTLLDNKLALQQHFIDVDIKDPLVMERQAGRQLHLIRADHELLILDPASLHKDRSITSLMSESLNPVIPQPPSLEIPSLLKPLLNDQFRKMVLILACLGLLLSFVLSVRHDKAPLR